MLAKGGVGVNPIEGVVRVKHLNDEDEIKQFLSRMSLYTTFLWGA